MAHRARISSLDKQRLLTAFQNGQDYVLLAGHLGVKADTAYRIVQRCLKRNGVVAVARGGITVEKVDTEMKTVVEEIIEENPCVTLKVINERLRQRCPGKPHVCDRTIGNICDGLLYTVKKLQIHGVNRNADHVKVERILYANWFLQEAILATRLVFVDESGFNMWTTRSQGRSKRGTPATKVVCAQRGDNVTLLLAISPHTGVIHFEFVRTSTTKLIFQEFINNAANSLPVVGETFIIMDNASVHSGAISPRADIVLKNLPPYSAPLNPIEEAFSCWKAALKAKLSETENHAIVMNAEEAAAAGMSLHQWRLHHLVNIGVQCMPVITQDKCQRFFNRSVSFVHRCLNSEDI